MMNNEQWLPAPRQLNPTGVIRQRLRVCLPQNYQPGTWGQMPAWNPPAVTQTARPAGMTAGTWLAIGTTFLSGAVMLDPKASKEAKAIASAIFGIAMPVALERVFAFEVWPA